MKARLFTAVLASLLVASCGGSETTARDSACGDATNCPGSVATPAPVVGGKDQDLDGVDDTIDNCPSIANDQRDSDGDGRGDACDSQSTTACTMDGLDLVPLVQPFATITSTTSASCVSCQVTNAEGAIDHDSDSPAVLNLGLNLLGYLSLSVQDTYFTYANHGQAGFVIGVPPSMLRVELLNSLSLTSYLAGEAQESADQSGTALSLDLLQLFANPERTFVGFEPSLPFDTLELSYGGVVQILPELHVFAACATPDSAGRQPTATPSSTPAPTTLPSATPTPTPAEPPADDTGDDPGVTTCPGSEPERGFNDPCGDADGDGWDNACDSNPYTADPPPQGSESCRVEYIEAVRRCRTSCNTSDSPAPPATNSPTATPAPSGTPTAPPTEGNYVPPELVKEATPVYPRRAMSRGVEGYCIVEYTVNSDGFTQDHVPVDCEPEGQFERSSIKALQNFEYLPGTVDGEPVDVPSLQWRFDYELQQ